MSEADRIKALYNDRIMELAGDIPLTERLEDPQATTSVRSPLCGSRITIDLDLEDGRVARYGQTVRACTLGEAAASIVGRHVVGASVDDLTRTTKAMRALLKNGETLPGDVWEDLKVLEPVRDFRSRHGSVMLAFDALEKAIAEIQGESASA